MAPHEPTNSAAQWLDEHGDALYRYALLRLGDHARAEDAVQEALLAALQAKGGFRGESSERTWLTGILRHKVLDALRSRSREARWIELARSTAESRDPRFSDEGWWTEPQHAPRSPLDREEARRALSKAIGELPEAMREVFCLRELDGVSTAQVCELLGLTPTNVWTLVHRAKLKLRTALADSGKEGETGR